MMKLKLGGKLKEWLRGSRDVATVKKHLPPGATARRGPKGRVVVEGSGLSYHLSPDAFNSAQEMAAYAASKLPR
jgi:hypothetical protein